jgi:hypothetical protein
MSDDPGEHLLASYPGLAAAVVAQNVLEAGGVPCRIADLANLPQYAFSIMGAYARPVGLWVLEADVERAEALLDSTDGDGSAVDEEALAAEALAAAPAPPGASPAAEVPVRRAPPARPKSQLLGPAAVALVIVAIAAAIASHACG